MEVLAGVVGVAVGVFLGGSGKYFSLRRDSWTRARACGLLLLAEVRALADARSGHPVFAQSRVGVTRWEESREELAAFRRGNFPNGFKAEEWLALARRFAALERLAASPAYDDTWWAEVRAELAGAERLLARFADDPPVFPYVVRAGAGKYWAALRSWFGGSAARAR